MNAALGFEAFISPAPPVAATVLHRAKGLQDVLPIAMDMRHSSRAVKMRAFCREVDESVRTGDRQQIEAAVAELAAMGVDLVKGFARSSDTPESSVGKRELATYQSPLGQLIAKLIPDSIRNLLPKLRTPRLAFLHELQGTPRTVSSVEKTIRAIGGWAETG